MGRMNRTVEEERMEIETFLVAIDQNGFILESSQNWADFSEANKVTDSLWKIGKNYFNHLRCLNKHKELLQIKKLLEKVEEEQQPFLFHMKDGAQQTFSVEARAVTFASGKTKGALLYHKPVNLHSIQQLTAEHILESMTEGFILLDNQYIVTYINEIGEQLLRGRSDEIVGNYFYERFPEAKELAFAQAYERTRKEKEVSEFIEFFPPLNTWFSVKACPLKKGGVAIYFHDISEQKATEAKLQKSINFDVLTGLPNRRFLSHTLKSLTAQKRKFSIFYINIDNLKVVNELYSYEAGDSLLTKVAEELDSLTSKYCEVGRLDGNDFIVILQAPANKRLELVAQDIQKVFEKPIALTDNQVIPVTVSIGIACFPYDAKNPEDTLSYAETAMHQAKQIRGSSFAFFRPIMKASQNRRSTIEKGLELGFREMGFYYALQPQIDSTTGQLAGVEVLSRWNHPELGEVSPLEFIKTAEETGTIAKLTSDLLKNVFSQIKEWEKRYGWNVRTAINMTPSLISSTSFFQEFFQLMDLYEVPPEFIEIEITEQAELTYSSRTIENLQLARSKGISIAIDDFGTGFSMISYLADFPINKMKIDKCFIRRIGQDDKSEAVLKSIIHLGRSIGCDLLAEGVERPEEADFLKQNGCTVFQGYFYDKPLAPEDFEAKYLQPNLRK